jgi:hypothetical protein
MNRFLFVLFFTLVAAKLTSCQSDEAVEPIGPQAVSLRISTRSGTGAVDTATTLTLGSTNARVRLRQFQLLLSDFKLTRAVGDTVRLTNSYVLYRMQADAPSMRYALDAVPEGSYTALTFTIGMPVSQNTQAGSDAKNPNSFPTGHPLNQTIVPASGGAGMFWSWNSGYIFQRFEGFVDTTAGNSGGALTAAGAAGGLVRPLVAHVGANGNQRTRTVPISLSLQRGENVIPLRVDVNAFFAGLNLKRDWDTHSFGGTVTAPATMSKAAMAQLIATNSVNAISVGN